MNERGHYGTTQGLIGAETAVPPSKPWWGPVLGYGLAAGFVGLLGYALFGVVESGRELDREIEKERRAVARWSPATQEKWLKSGLTVDAFKDWEKSGRGMTVNEWLRATPEKK